jgi:NADH-quinone oxidoreductase subunit J
MPESVNGLAFGLLAVALLLGAFSMVSTRNVVHAGYWLLETLVATAGIYLLLSAEFLAIAQLMVYAGAVAVMVLFVVMLTLRRREDAERSLDFSWGPLIGAIALGGGVMLALREMRVPPATLPNVTPGVAELGRVLYTTWVLPFELASLVLLVALVGAVWWATGGERR